MKKGRNATVEMNWSYPKRRTSEANLVLR